MSSVPAKGGGARILVGCRGSPQAESREKAGSAVRVPPLPELR